MTTTQGERTFTGWTADDGTFGARLALVRQRMGWGNVKEAAAACGLPTESWRTWERDNVVPRRIREIASTIAVRTGCDYGWLLDGPRLAGVYRVNVQISSEGDHRPEASVRKAIVAERSGRTAEPNRVRPPDHRPSGHPKFPVLPPKVSPSSPAFARPVRRPRPA